MKISYYISSKKINKLQAAQQLGVTGEAVRQWIAGTRIPSAEKMQKIYRWSRGAVQPNDFYDLSDPGPLDGLPLFSGVEVNIMK